MDLLLVSATKMEVSRLVFPVPSPGFRVDLCITGVGLTATTYSLTKQLTSHKYDFVLQVGVGGSFNRNLAQGDVVFIYGDQFGDLGAENHGEYLDIFEMGLEEKNAAPFTGGVLVTPDHPIHQKMRLPGVSGLTVNTVSGSESTIKNRIQKYGCDVESMEGAAFHYVCLQEHVPFAQVRSISNYVTPRDKSQWRMKDAIINLNTWLSGFLAEL